MVKALAARGFAAATASPPAPTPAAARRPRSSPNTSPASRQIDELEAFEPGSELEPLLEWSRNAQGDADVCWVGHSPDVERLAAALIGDGSARIRFAKGAVAAIGFEDEIEHRRRRTLLAGDGKVAGSVVDSSGDGIHGT